MANQPNHPPAAPNASAAGAGRPLRDRVGLSLRGIGALDAPALVETIRQAEQTGVPQVWITQNPTSTDALTAYAAAMPQTRTVRLGTSIVPIYGRHPLLLAQQAATVAGLGPGRLRLGIGTSHRRPVQSVYGLKMEAPLEHLAEYVAVLRAALWAGQVDHEGAFYTAHVSLPVAPRVPLLIAALGERAFALAGEIADGAISWNAPAQYLIDTALPALRAGAAGAGRPAPPLVAHVPVVLGDDAAAARAAAAGFVGVYARMPFYTNMWAAAGYPLTEDGAVHPGLIDNLVVMGDEAAVAERLRALLAAGLDELLLTGLPVGDPAAAQARLMRLIGAL